MIDKQSVLDARRIYYSLLSKLFVFSWDDDRFSGVKEILDLIAANPMDENSQKALWNLQAAFGAENLEGIVDEYDRIFHAPPNPIRTSISFYEEGYESSGPCLEIRNMLLKTKFRRDEKRYKDGEDNFGFLFSLMSNFIELGKSQENYQDLSDEIFARFLNPYIDEFIEKLYTHPKAEIYRSVAALMASFFVFERIYYDSVAPQSGKNIKVQEGLSRAEAARRESNKQRRQNDERRKKELS